MNLIINFLVSLTTMCNVNQDYLEVYTAKDIYFINKEKLCVISELGRHEHFETFADLKSFVAAQTALDSK